MRWNHSFEHELENIPLLEKTKFLVPKDLEFNCLIHNIRKRINMSPNGISTIVSLREDLLKVLDKNKDLNPLDDDLRELFKSWFNPGFLKLAKITWDTKVTECHSKYHACRDQTLVNALVVYDGKQGINENIGDIFQNVIKY